MSFDGAQRTRAAPAPRRAGQAQNIHGPIDRRMWRRSSSSQRPVGSVSAMSWRREPSITLTARLCLSIGFRGVSLRVSDALARYIVRHSSQSLLVENVKLASLHGVEIYHALYYR